MKIKNTKELKEFLETFASLKYSKRILVNRIQNAKTRAELWETNMKAIEDDMYIARRFAEILID